MSSEFHDPCVAPSITSTSIVGGQSVCAISSATDRMPFCWKAFAAAIASGKPSTEAAKARFACLEVVAGRRIPERCPVRCDGVPGGCLPSGALWVLYFILGGGLRIHFAGKRATIWPTRRSSPLRVYSHKATGAGNVLTSVRELPTP
eukprot:scaffold4488_cov117-Isochrysis_galbana.AAC.5